MAQKKALILEDTAANRLFFERLLSQAGFEIIAAETGKEALEKIADEAKKLAEMAQKVDVEASHIGGVSNLIKQLLENPKTQLTENTSSKTNWSWPIVQNKLLLKMVNDGFISNTNEVTFVYDPTGMYVNGNKIVSSKVTSYTSIFQSHKIKLGTDFSFHKKGDNIVLLNSGGKIKSFFADLKKEGLLTSSNENVSFKINGYSAFKNGQKLADSDIRKINAIALKNDVIPAPGKTIEIIKKGYKMGYSVNENTHYGTWIEE